MDHNTAAPPVDPDPSQEATAPPGETPSPANPGFWDRYGTGPAQRLAWLAVVVGQAATVWVTWEVWQARETPPLLPLIDGLPGVSLGWLMLATLAVTVWRPRVGAIAHLVVLGAAVALDQTRLQPEFVSLGILLAAVTFPSAAVAGRAHLATLWIWAGVHKLLSTGFATGGAVFIANGIGVPVGVMVWLSPLSEIAAGLLALWWRTRYLAVVAAFAVHGAIVYTLVAQRWNTAVWPWNLAIPFAALYLLTTPQANHLLRRIWDARRLTTATAAAVAVWAVAWIYPAGFYVGAADTYLAHNLYSSNTRHAVVCSMLPGAVDTTGAACVDVFSSSWFELNVPVPPETRIYRRWFAETCRDNEVLRVHPIQTVLTRNATPIEYACPGDTG